MITDALAEQTHLLVPLSVRQIIALREIAARDRQTAEQYVALMISNLVHGVTNRDGVLTGWAQGLTDAEICAATGLDRSQVATRRRAAGLPAHRRPARGRTRGAAS